MESLPEFDELLKKGAKLPLGMSYRDFEKLSPAAKNIFYQEVWHARTTGRELKFLGQEAGGAAKLARGGKLVPGLHYLVVGAFAYATFNDARAAGMSDAGAVVYTDVDAVSPVGAVVPPSVFTGSTARYTLADGPEEMTIIVRRDGDFQFEPGVTPGAPIIDTATLKRMMQR